MSVGSDSETATSVMRPDIVAGPMNRNRTVFSMAESGDVCAAAGSTAHAVRAIAVRKRMA